MTSTKLSHVVLIDDNSADTFLHRLILEDSGVAETIHSFLYAQDALDFLADPASPPIDLIFLDINMPRMNGFEFLETYEQMQPDRKAKAVIVMLTTSHNPEDRTRALSHSEVTDFFSKPLSEEAVQQIVANYFG